MGQLRDTILAAEDLAREPADAPEWGVDAGALFITELCAADTSRLGRYFVDAQAAGTSVDDYDVQLLALALVDADGARVFDQPGDITALGRKNQRVIKRLYEQAEKLNKLDEASIDAEKKKLIEDPLARFHYRLAMELGYIHPDVMLRQMTAAQATGWLAYATLEPVGNPVDIKTEADRAAARRTMRDEFESGMRALMARGK